MKILVPIGWLCVLVLTSVIQTQAAARSRPASAASSKDVQKIEITHRSSVAAVNAPADHFTGTVHVVALFKPNGASRATGTLITFEPSARTAWHSHPGGQTLIVTEGVGWVQQWGGPVEIIRKGDVVRVPPGVKHWHGATAAAYMSHIAIVEALDGKTADWMEKVSDDQYKGPQP
jgi:4-carboxymuconolactone decarboxylase